MLGSVTGEMVTLLFLIKPGYFYYTWTQSHCLHVFTILRWITCVCDCGFKMCFNGILSAVKKLGATNKKNQ